MSALYTQKHERVRSWGKIVTSVNEYSRLRAKNLVYHLYEKGYTYAEVGKILGTTRQAVQQTWPKGKV